MRVFENSSLVLAPIREVADFHHDSRVLRR